MDLTSAGIGKGEAADAKGLGDKVEGRAIMDPCFVSEAKESEKNEGAERG